MDDYKCPECGYEGEPETYKGYENSDADGNRGIWVTWVECPECGYVEGYTY